MLDRHLHQGAGLHSISSHPAPRMMAVASQGVPNFELPLLWSLCTAIEGIEATLIAVLDGTTEESAGNPGLLQLLDNGVGQFASQGEFPHWKIIPSAKGLQVLGLLNQATTPPLVGLGRVLQGVGVVVIYAHAETLTRVLAHSGIEPLLAVCPSDASRVNAYQSLKRMLLNADLHPTIATMASEPLRNRHDAGHAVCKSLQDCALIFLGYRLDAFILPIELPGENPSREMYGLAMRMLKHAMPLQRHEGLTLGHPMSGTSADLVGGH